MFTQSKTFTQVLWLISALFFFAQVRQMIVEKMKKKQEINLTLRALRNRRVKTVKQLYKAYARKVSFSQVLSNRFYNNTINQTSMLEIMSNFL